MALTPDKVQALAHQASTYACQALLSNDRWQEVRDQKFAELVEADARRDALTKAERICDHYATALDGGANEYTRSRECMQAANAIRALKEAPPTAA
ncbi:hypothetical protein [Acidovorax kalamii]|uniref:hypothetical protein n=1 Tax=Acidovorax kalamii TaxID=2004485 RepID=UPI0020907EB7|nr:hypothetical protein [Acidovorax kalamii]MCO5355123.1 hypothetical protein [Acidovorax kalamii]